jgi:hypothetical protein
MSPQPADQFVFLGNTESVKVGKLVHARSRERAMPCT